MSEDHFNLAAEARQRRGAMLKTAFGPAIGAALADPCVIEIMVNPDGRLWLDRTDMGRIDTGERLRAAETERIIRLIAAHMGQEAHGQAPIVSAELPDAGERFEGVLPPVAPAACFSIRKPAGVIYRLDDYVGAGTLTGAQASRLRRAIAEKRNIVVAGGTGSGKTTFVNALLAEIAGLDERVIILEDTRELQCAASDCVSLRTKPGAVTLGDLVRSTLRLRPDRIIVGEVRGEEALDMLKAWNTGHPGGLTTLHANSARAVLDRLEQLTLEAIAVPPRALIAEAIDVVVFLRGRHAARRVEAIAHVDGLDASGGYALRFEDETNPGEG
ncbi:MAG: P-type conjugative transfer ATPase TrbB [Hyphomicrobiales bacterium]|nr:P-type conjugative transfer ATPase TrbB [Hyphomicrobiales bacterium]